MKSVFVFAVAALFATALRADFPVTDGSVICVGGDSILDWGNGATYIETYLRLCAGQKNTSCFRDASGGTTMNYFKATMRDMMPFLRPTHFIMMYGMNDGGLRYSEANASAYRTNITEIVRYFRDVCRCDVVVATPSPVDTYGWTLNSQGYTGHDSLVMRYDNLRRLAGIARATAAAEGARVASIFEYCDEIMPKAKRDRGEKYSILGADGVHAKDNGQMLFAYAFLEQLLGRNEIGSIVIDVKAGKVETSAGHRVRGYAKGVAEIESERYPFCFNSRRDENPERDAYGLVKYLAFEGKFNLFKLVVRGLEREKAQVRWGRVAKTFTRAELEAGVNLAREWVSETPFQESFAQVLSQVDRRQRRLEGVLRSGINGRQGLDVKYKDDKELIEVYRKLGEKLFKIRARESQALAATIRPVRHVIEVVPL